MLVRGGKALKSVNAYAFYTLAYKVLKIYICIKPQIPAPQAFRGVLGAFSGLIIKCIKWEENHFKILIKHLKRRASF